MDQATSIHDDPFLAALRELSGMHLLPPAVAEAMLHLPPQTFDAWRANQEPVPPLMAVEGQQGYLAGDLVQYIEQVPKRRGPMKIHHPSFAEFLTHGRPDDTWVFGMVALDFHGMRRPVDLVTCLELPTVVLANAHYPHMTLKVYVRVMDDYLSRFEDQLVAEAEAVARVEHALGLAPSTRSSSRVHHS